MHQMIERKRRGKVSKIALLPGEIKAKLDELLRDGKLMQKDILLVVNKLIDEAGLSDDKKLSAAGVNRYSTQMFEAFSRIQQSRAVAEQWVVQLGDKPLGDVGKMLIEMVRTLVFETTMNASSSDEPMEPKMIKELSLAINNLEKAANESIKREKEIKKAFADAAAETIDQTAKQAGLTSEGATLIKKQILGLA